MAVAAQLQQLTKTVQMGLEQQMQTESMKNEAEEERLAREKEAKQQEKEKVRMLMEKRKKALRAQMSHLQQQMESLDYLANESAESADVSPKVTSSKTQNPVENDLRYFSLGEGKVSPPGGRSNKTEGRGGAATRAGNKTSSGARCGRGVLRGKNSSRRATSSAVVQ